VAREGELTRKSSAKAREAPEADVRRGHLWQEGCHGASCPMPMDECQTQVVPLREDHHVGGVAQRAAIPASARRMTERWQESKTGSASHFDRINQEDAERVPPKVVRPKP